ncbi:MAG: DUF456 domain-containing protein [Bacteroidaceae bacterium]|nr:DUF456 domain-containing protein [Bacteroidaceae bacterium]
MWSTVLIVLAIILCITGIIGSVVPGLPGPPLSWVGVLLAYLSHKLGGADMSMTFVLVWLGVTVVVSVLDYTVPARFTKLAGGTKAGSTGATIGMIIGMFLTPIGMIPCSLLGAFLAEWLQENKSIWGALKAAAGTFIGFLLGSGLKIIASGTMLFYILF